jgi:AmmeMemoRadiSam system protein A
MSPPRSSSVSPANAAAHSQVSSAADQPPVTEYSPEERVLLLRLAHDSIRAALAGAELSLASPTPRLAEPRGVFTSLYSQGDLRGCVGYVFPSSPLYRAVAETARAAAFDDPRFPPLRPDEEPTLEIELSILTPPQPIRAGEVEVGRHGLLITMHGHRGLLLPQVAVDRGWDRTTFLEQTCLKAGLPADVWQKGATIESFTAEVFGTP